MNREVINNIVICEKINKNSNGQVNHESVLHHIQLPNKNIQKTVVVNADFVFDLNPTNIKKYLNKKVVLLLKAELLDKDGYLVLMEWNLREILEEEGITEDLNEKYLYRYLDHFSFEDMSLFGEEGHYIFQTILVDQENDTIVDDLADGKELEILNKQLVACYKV